MYFRLFTLLLLIAFSAPRAGAQTPIPSPGPSPGPSPVPSPSPAPSSGSNDYVFPIFVDGTLGGLSYRSVLRVTNTSGTNPLACTVNQRNTSANFIGIQNYFYP